jgi:Ran GTPase-activating protein (RanGAP) involved in mRNA processing and transport
MVVACLIPVMGWLTKISLAANELGEEGTKAICEALEQNKTLKELDISGDGYSASNIGGSAGATHVAKMLGVNGGLTSIDLSNNQLCGVWTDYHGQHGTYTAEGITAIADAMRVNGALTVTNLLGNKLDAESAKMLAEVAKRKGISLCGIQVRYPTNIKLQRDQTTADFSGQGLNPPDAILLASDLSQAVVTGGLTALDLSYNCLEDEGVSAVCKAIQNNKETKLASLNFENNGIGPVGANAVAAMVAVTGGLTSINLSGNALCGLDWHTAEGIYTAEGITAIADALRVNGALTKIE